MALSENAKIACVSARSVHQRLRRAMKALWQWCRDHRHENMMEQYKTLCLKLRGHYQYYGIRGNVRPMEVVKDHVQKAWRYWLSRRGNKHPISWDEFDRLRRRMPLPKPRIYHAAC